MKKIRIKICGFDENNRHSSGYFIFNILKKYYDVELSEDPDYLFYEEPNSEHLKYDCIKIFYTGENITPNFNLCDYAIGFDYMDFGDRYFRLPVYLLAVFYNKGELEMAGDINFKNKKIFGRQDLSDKTDFCSFVYSNYLSDSNREVFFKKLNNYKQVNSGGRYLNNIGGNVENKLEFELKHKFSIAFENSSRLGYTTEKIVCSFVANTIPIYWGNPEIGREFNEKRFINCHNYDNFDQVVERVKEIDNNDDLYLNIVNEPVLAENYDFNTVRNGFEVFLKNIIDQPLENVKRKTINFVKAKELERGEIIASKYFKRRLVFRKLFAKLYKPFKKIKILESLKEKFFRYLKNKIKK